MTSIEYVYNEESENGKFYCELTLQKDGALVERKVNIEFDQNLNIVKATYLNEKEYKEEVKSIIILTFLWYLFWVLMIVFC